MRADSVDVSWDESKGSWLIRITSGEEVIRRHAKLARNVDPQTLRATVQKALGDEGYEASDADTKIAVTS
jgi:hypothetical protein